MRYTSAGSRRLTLVVALAIAMLTLVACGRDDDGGGGGGGGGEDGELATAPGFDGKRFKLGLLTATSGPVAATAGPSLAGIQTYYKAINEKGGIAGKYPVDLVLRDTAFDPAKAVQGYNATKNDVAMYAQVFGAAITLAVLPQLKTDNIVALAGSSDGSYFRSPNIITSFTPFESQLVNIVDYAIKKDGKRKVCGAGVEGSNTATVESGLEQAGESLGVEVGPVVALPSASTQYTPQVQQLRREGCEVVFALAAPVPVLSSLFSAAARLDYEPQWLGSNTGFVAAMKDSPVFGYLKENYLQASDGTLYGDTENAPGMQELMDAHEKFAKDTLPDWPFTSGWVSSMMTSQVLEKAVEMGDVSREGIMKALNSITDFDFGGIQFSPAWGPPDARKPPSKYGVFAPDESSDIGIKAIEYGLDAPAAAVDFPYPEPKE